MQLNNLPVAEEVKPISAYLEAPENASLAMIVGVDGPSYRPLGALMTLLGNDRWVGTLSSGCVESDINYHAGQAHDAKAPMLVKYGKGSPFMDIQLPCGGGLEVLILPDPDRKTLSELNAKLDNRTPCTLKVELPNGDLTILPEGKTRREGDTLYVRYEPDPMFLIFGKGPEASTFSALAKAAGYPSVLISPDSETLESAKQYGCETRYIPEPQFPKDLNADHRTAVTLFFHDHDWEPDILLGALETEAFYIGAQGSRAANAARMYEMKTKGATDVQLARLSGPIGLIPSARDAKTLAVSVLAEVLLKSQNKQS